MSSDRRPQGRGQADALRPVRQCAEACPNGAITQNAKGVYTVNKKLCTGCGKSVEACPFGVMVKAETSEFASKCIACGICAKACPMELLEVVEK